jgi:hypothetical protein
MDNELRLVPPIDEPAESIDQPAPAIDAPKWTITASDLLAREIAEAIDAIAARIPGLEAPHPSTARKVRGGRTVSRDFVLSIAGVVESRADLEASGIFNVEKALYTYQFNDAFRPVARRLAFLLASLNYTMDLGRANVARAALVTYSVIRRLARTDGALRTYVTIFRHKLGRKAGKPAPEEETTEEAVEPPKDE